MEWDVYVLDVHKITRFLHGGEKEDLKVLRWD